MSDLTIAVPYPELLGLYADRGNALALRHRAALRGIDAEVLEINLGDPVPEGADVYVLGGGEDAAIKPALETLREQDGLRRARERGAVILGVCAGFQILGNRLEDRDGDDLVGLGFLDIESYSLPGPRAVGEISTHSPVLGELQGFENHRGDARLGAGVTPLARVEHGVGNGHDGTEGAVDGNVIGTYLHGPALVRNPAFADDVLARATGTTLEPLNDDLIERFRRERRADLLRDRRPGQGRRSRLPWRRSRAR